MKKLLLGVLLGFMLHKGFQAAHSYAWWTAEATPECRKENPPFDCIHKKLGLIEYVGLSTIAPTFPFRKWEWRY